MPFDCWQFSSKFAHRARCYVGPRLLICILCNKRVSRGMQVRMQSFEDRAKFIPTSSVSPYGPRGSPGSVLFRRFWGIIELARLPSRPFVRTRPKETKAVPRGWSEFPSDRRLSRRWFYKLSSYRAVPRDTFLWRSWRRQVPVGNFENIRPGKARSFIHAPRE